MKILVKFFNSEVFVYVIWQLGLIFKYCMFFKIIRIPTSGFKTVRSGGILFLTLLFILMTQMTSHVP